MCGYWEQTWADDSGVCLGVQDTTVTAGEDGMGSPKWKKEMRAENSGTNGRGVSEALLSEGTVEDGHLKTRSGPCQLSRIIFHQSSIHSLIHPLSNLSYQTLAYMRPGFVWLSRLHGERGSGVTVLEKALWWLGWLKEPQCYECGPLTSRTSILWVKDRNADSQVSPQTTWSLCCNKILRWQSCSLKVCCCYFPFLSFYFFLFFLRKGLTVQCRLA
jgi:hypothetical protein